MRIVYHLGAPATDADRLVRCLMRNRVRLAEEGIAVPSPARYRTLLRDTAVELRGAPASPELEARLLAGLTENAPGARLILSWAGFLPFPAEILQSGLGRPASERVRAFTRLFPGCAAEFALAIRNPATFVSDLWADVRSADASAPPPVQGLERLRWSKVITGLQAILPDVPITVWCDEDTPLIWPEVLQAVAGHAPATVLQHTDELLAQILTETGFQRLQAYTAERPPKTVAHRRRSVTAFLERFAREDQTVQEVDVPGWDEAMVARITAGYEADIDRVRTLPGVTFLES
jgi:hypothetical protein